MEGWKERGRVGECVVGSYCQGDEKREKEGETNCKERERGWVRERPVGCSKNKVTQAELKTSGLR